MLTTPLVASGSVITSVIVCVLKQTCFVFNFPNYIAISRGPGIIVRIYFVTAVAQHCTRAAITPRRSRNIPSAASGVAMEFIQSVIAIFIRTTPQASEIYVFIRHNQGLKKREKLGQTINKKKRRQNARFYSA